MWMWMDVSTSWEPVGHSTSTEVGRSWSVMVPRGEKHSLRPSPARAKTRLDETATFPKTHLAYLTHAAKHDRHREICSLLLLDFLQHCQVICPYLLVLQRPKSSVPQKMPTTIQSQSMNPCPHPDPQRLWLKGGPPRAPNP